MNALHKLLFYLYYSGPRNTQQEYFRHATPTYAGAATARARTRTHDMACLCQARPLHTLRVHADAWPRMRKYASAHKFIITVARSSKRKRNICRIRIIFHGSGIAGIAELKQDGANISASRICKLKSVPIYGSFSLWLAPRRRWVVRVMPCLAPIDTNGERIVRRSLACRLSVDFVLRTR